jgi:hypothetical protein
MDGCKSLGTGARGGGALRGAAIRNAPARGGGLRGRAVQVDLFKPTLKPPGSTGLKVKCDVLASNLAFKFNLRRYSEAAVERAEATRREEKKRHEVSQCRFSLSNPR